jgi:hypothetical protein
MFITCLSHVYHMFITCLSHVYHMFITCLSHVYRSFSLTLPAFAAVNAGDKRRHGLIG